MWNLSSWTGLNPMNTSVKHGVLTTGLLGKSRPDAVIAAQTRPHCSMFLCWLFSVHPPHLCPHHSVFRWVRPMDDWQRNQRAVGDTRVFIPLVPLSDHCAIHALSVPPTLVSSHLVLLCGTYPSWLRGPDSKKDAPCPCCLQVFSFAKACLVDLLCVIWLSGRPLTGTRGSLETHRAYCKSWWSLLNI